MANVLFKRGLHANLPAANAATDGVFYLTTDTNRLYVGQGTKLVELNKSITLVDNLSDLPTSTSDESKAIKGSQVQVGQFYYVKAISSGSQTVHNGNILAVCSAITDGTITWTQINPDTSTDDTYVTGISFGAGQMSTIDGSKQISYPVTLTRQIKNVSGSTSAASDVVGNLVISQEDIGRITTDTAISVVSSDIAVNGTSTKISASGVGSVANNGVTVNAGNNITLTGTNNSLTIAAKDTWATAVTADSTGKISITPNSGSKVESGQVLYHKITVSDSIGTAGTEVTKYNQASLGSFYSKSAIDAWKTELDGKVKDINAMVYRGTVDKATDLPSSGVKIGDTYLVSANFGDYKKGDLLIANGIESDDGLISGEVSWDKISIDTDTDTQYSFSVDSNKISVTPNPGSTTDIAEIAGDNVKLEATTSGNKITISHKTISGLTNNSSFGPAANATPDYNQTFVVPRITVDNYGHITAISDKTVTIPASDNTTYEIKAANVSNVPTITLTPSTGSSTAVTFASDTLAISAANDVITANLEWGQF